MTDGPVLIKEAERPWTGEPHFLAYVRGVNAIVRKAGSAASYMEPTHHYTVYELARAAIGHLCARLPPSEGEPLMKDGLDKLDQALAEAAMIRR